MQDNEEHYCQIGILADNTADGWKRLKLDVIVISKLSFIQCLKRSSVIGCIDEDVAAQMEVVLARPASD